MGNFSSCPFREKLIFNHDFKSQSKLASQPVYREPVQGMTSKYCQMCLQKVINSRPVNS